MQNFDAVFVQETHIDTDVKARRFEQLWGGRVYWSYGSNYSAGVAILFKPHARLEILSTISGENGRVLSVGVKIKDTLYNFISVYARC